MNRLDSLDTVDENEIFSDEEIKSLIDIERDATLEDEESGVDKKTTRMSVLGLESDQAWQKKVVFFRDLCERFEIILESSIVNLLRISVSAEKLPIGHSTYRRVVNSAFADPENLSCIVLLPFRENNLKTPDIIELDMNLAFLMIDLNLSGDGLSIPKKSKITDFERSIMGRIMTKIKRDLTQVWHPSLELIDSPPKVLSYLDLVEVSYQEQPVISFPFRLTLQNDSSNPITGNFTVHIPYSIMSVEKLYIDNLDKADSKGTEKSSRTSIQEKVMDISLDLQVCFPPRPITVGELLNLKSGDIIKLGITTESKLNVKLEERTKFLGTPVLAGNWRAVKISNLPPNWNT